LGGGICFGGVPICLVRTLRLGGCRMGRWSMGMLGRCGMGGGMGMMGMPGMGMMGMKGMGFNGGVGL
jgi:hypothetical protein